MSSQPVDHLHPVADFARRLGAKLDSLAEVPLWSMSPEELRQTAKALAKDRAQLDALDLQVLAELERQDATTESGAASAADWIAVQTRQVRREARSDLRLAQALDRHDVLTSAMAEGRVNKAQARAIVAALDRLPTAGEFAVSTEQRAQAEDYLVAMAEHHDAKALRILGGRIFEVIAPDLAEEFDGKALEKEEAEALRRTTFTMFEDDEGTCHGRFRIPAAQGQMLHQDDPRDLPRRRSRASDNTGEPSASGIDPDLPTPVRHGIALTQLIETYPAEQAPQDRRLHGHRRGHHDPRPTHRRPRPPPGSAPSTPAAASPPPKPAASPAPPASSRSSSAGRARSSTSAADAACTPSRCAWPWACATAAAPPKAARPRPASATPTTTNPGPKADPPTSTPAACSARTTTAASTTPPTRPGTSPAARSASTGGRRPTVRSEAERCVASNTRRGLPRITGCS